MSASKFCPSCRETLPLEEFWRHIGHKDGLQTYCKKCTLLKHRKRLAKNIGVRERLSLKGAQWRADRPGYYKENRAKNAARSAELQRLRRAKNPDEPRAQNRITRLVRSGKLPRPADCQCDSCGKQAAHYHHHRGYAREHWEDVIPVCRSCHAKHHSPHDWKL